GCCLHANDRRTGRTFPPVCIRRSRCAPMKTILFPMLGAMAVFAAGVAPSTAGDRYADWPPVMVSPDLSAPWVLQLGHAPGIVRQNRQIVQQQPRLRATQQPDRVQTAAVQPPAKRVAMRPQINPIFLPQE